MIQQKKKQSYSRRTKIRLPQGQAGTVTVSVIGFLGVLAKFSYILFINDRKNGEVFEIFGYKYLSHFLWAFGNEVFAFCIGAVLWTSTTLHFTNSKARMPFRWIGYFTMATATYFSVWIFYDGNKFTKEVQFVMAAIFSLVAGGIYVLLLKLLTREITNFRQMKEEIIEFFVEIKEVHYMRMLLRILRKDSYSEAEKEDIRQDTVEFDIRMNEKGKEIAEK